MRDSHNSSKSVVVRDAAPSDVAVLVRLISEMSHHEQIYATITQQRLTEDGFGASPKFRAVVAEIDSDVAGYALFFDCYSSFRGAGTFLEDLFVRPAYRAKGLGDALLSRIAAHALKERHFGIIFNVSDWNTGAVGFFQGKGALDLKRGTFELSADRLQALAQSI